MHDFVLISNWEVAATIEDVWAALHDVKAWPRWWKYVRAVTEIEHGDAAGNGAVRRFTWATRLPYEITFDMRSTRVQRPYVIEGEANGDLNGTGRWELRDLGPVTRVTYEWRVRADKPWMKWFALLLRPVFIWNHNGVMRAGKAGLEREISARKSGVAQSSRVYRHGINF